MTQETRAMRKIEWHCETGFVGADRAGEFEIEADATEEQIEEAVREEVFNYISWGWEEVRRPEQKDDSK